jgi:hypothetical protein
MFPGLSPEQQRRVGEVVLQALERMPRASAVS